MHRVTVLSQGTPLVSGSPEEVRSNPAVLDAYLGGEDDEATQQKLVKIGARSTHDPRSRLSRPRASARTRC